MEAWIAGLIFVIAGYCVWGLMFLARQLEIRSGIMRARRPWKVFEKSYRRFGVPGPWDYWTNGLGDLFALPFIDFAVGTMAYQNGVSIFLMTTVVCIGVVGAHAFYRRATITHRASQDIDWWFRFEGTASGWKAKAFGSSKVRVNIAGYIHLAYFALQIGMSALGLWFIIQNDANILLVVLGFIGGVMYLAACFLDQRQGHFV